MIDDSGVTVIFHAPESDGIKPVYTLSVSDCGWGSSRITPGYILDEEQKFWYAADKAISLNANAIQESIDEALTACDIRNPRARKIAIEQVRALSVL